MKRALLVFVCASVLVGVGCVTEEEAAPEASLYGRIKADVIYDTAEMSGTSAQYVKSESGDTLSFTSRESRLGVKFKQGENLSGKVEWDFYGGTTVNKPNALLRQLWMKMKLTDQMSVLVGQTGDVFSPLLPAVLNYGWGWNCGNPGYRRPQARFECTVGPLVAQVAAERGIDTEASAAADLHGRLGYVLKDDEGKQKLAVGFSGIQGFADANRDTQRLGTAIDLQVNMGPLVLRGELMPWGDNLSSYSAGIGQDVKTQAGWIQLGVNLSGKLTVNLGYMCDDPVNEDVRAEIATGGKLRNYGVFLNVRANLNPKTQVGAELINWNTAYDGGANLDNTRLSGSVIFTF